jgi:hypothetical protein
MLVNGLGPLACFYNPVGLAYEASTGAVYVVDQLNHVLRRLTPGSPWWVVRVSRVKATRKGAAVRACKNKILCGSGGPSCMPYGGRPMVGMGNGAGVGAMVGAMRGGAADAMDGGAAAAAASLALRFLFASADAQEDVSSAPQRQAPSELQPHL